MGEALDDGFGAMADDDLDAFERVGFGEVRGATIGNDFPGPVLEGGFEGLGGGGTTGGGADAELEFGEDGGGELDGVGLEALPFEGPQGGVEAGGGDGGGSDKKGDSEEDLEEDGGRLTAELVGGPNHGLRAGLEGLSG